MDENNSSCAGRRRRSARPIHAPAPHRGFIAEWTVTIILLLFGTTQSVQAFVIPTGSMEDTLLVGDHLLVDKLAYAPPDGGVASICCPIREVKRGDIIVFRYPVDIQQTFVKRCIGVPGDRIRLVDKNLILNGQAVDRAVRLSQERIHRSLPRRFSRRAGRPHACTGAGYAAQPRGERRSGGAAGLLFRHGRQPRSTRSTAATGASCRAPISSASR